MATKDSKIKNANSVGTRISEQDDKKETRMKNVVAVARRITNGKQEEEEENGRGISLPGIPMVKLKLGPKKKLLVLPLTGIIVHRSHRSRPATVPKNRPPDFCYGNFMVYKRPFCKEFFEFCFERFQVGLWSSANEHNLLGILINVMGVLKNKLLFTWDQKQCINTGFKCWYNKDKPVFLKDLNHLWQQKYPINRPWRDGEYSASNTLLITGPEKALINPPNTSIFPQLYDPENMEDDFLGPNGELRVFLDGLADAKDVQSYVKDHPIGQPAITPSHSEWDYYSKIICSFGKKETTDHKK